MILIVVDTLRLAGAAVVLMALEWRLGLVALIPLPFIAYALRLFNRRTRPIYRRVRDRLGDINDPAPGRPGRNSRNPGIWPGGCRTGALLPR